MTAATTSPNKKKSFFSVRLKSRFSQDMKLLITNIVFHLLCLPVLAGVLLREMYINEHDLSSGDESLPFLITAVIALMLSIALGFVIPMINFRYLYNKSLVDMNYSLPLNNRQRFFADYISGLVTYIAPLLIGITIAAIEILIGSAFIDMHEFFKFVPLILKCTFIVILGLIMQYSLTVLAINFAGSTFEALFSIAAINIMIPSFISLTWGNIVSAAHFGLDGISIVMNYTFFTTSPVGVLGYIIYFLNISDLTPSIYEKEQFYYFTNANYTWFLLRTLLFTFIIIMVSYLLYKHRKAEDVSKPYVYKGFYYAIMTVIVYCIVSLMNISSSLNSLLAALIISGIIWFVMEVIRRRGFKRFWTAAVGFAAASAAVVGIIKVIDVTNGLGRAKYTPSVSSVTDMVVNLGGRNKVLYTNNFIFHDKQLISDVIEFNKEIVDRHFYPNNYEYELVSTQCDQYTDSYDKMSIDITYYTKSGAAIVRNYSVPTAMLANFACDMYTSEEYAEQRTKKEYVDSLRKGNDSFPVYADNLADAKFSLITLVDKRGRSKEVNISVEEGKELFDALCTDITCMTLDDLKNSEYYCELNGMILNSACHNTIAFMDEHDIVYKNTSKETIRQMNKDSRSIAIYSDPEYLFPIYAYSDSDFFSDYYYYESRNSKYCRDCIKLETILSLDIYRNRISYDDFIEKSVDVNSADAVEKLLDIATPIVIDEKVIAEVYFLDSTLYVTDRPGYREIVEEAKKSLGIIDINNEPLNDTIG